MPRSHHRNRRPAQQLRVAADPQHRRRIVNLAQAFGIFRAGIARASRPAQPRAPTLLRARRPLPSKRNCAAAAGNRSPSGAVSGRVNIWLADLSCFTASIIRLGPRPGASVRASHASRSSSTFGLCADSHPRFVSLSLPPLLRRCTSSDIDTVSKIRTLRPSLNGTQTASRECWPTLSPHEKDRARRSHQAGRRFTAQGF